MNRFPVFGVCIAALFACQLLLGCEDAAERAMQEKHARKTQLDAILLAASEKTLVLDNMMKSNEVAASLEQLRATIVNLDELEKQFVIGKTAHLSENQLLAIAAAYGAKVEEGMRLYDSLADLVRPTFVAIEKALEQARTFAGASSEQEALRQARVGVELIWPLRKAGNALLPVAQKAKAAIADGQKAGATLSPEQIKAEWSKAAFAVLNGSQ